MAPLRRRYNLRKRNHKGCTDGTIGKKRIPELRQCRHKRNNKPTKKSNTCPRPRRRQMGLARMTKQQLAREYEIERKKRALACREQAVARMERAIARRERALGLWEKNYSRTTFLKMEETTSPTKKCPARKPKAAPTAARQPPHLPDPEVVIVHHYDRDHPRSAATTIDLTSTTETTERRHDGPRSREADSVSLRIMNALGRRLVSSQKPTPAKVKPPSNTMFSGQGSNVRWQPSVFPMDSGIHWPPPRSQQRPTSSNGQAVKTEPDQSPATH